MQKYLQFLYLIKSNSFYYIKITNKNLFFFSIFSTFLLLSQSADLRGCLAHACRLPELPKTCC